MQFLTYYDVSQESIFNGILFFIFIYTIFTLFACGLLIAKKSYKGNDHVTLKKLKIAKVWSIVVLVFVIQSLYFLISKKLEDKNSFKNGAQILVEEGKIRAYQPVKKEVGLVSFHVNNQKFETTDTFIECTRKDCGLYNGLNIRITYTHKYSNNLIKDPDSYLGVGLVKKPHKNKILRIELEKEDFKKVNKRNESAYLECFHSGICE